MRPAAGALVAGLVLFTPHASGMSSPTMHLKRAAWGWGRQSSSSEPVASTGTFAACSEEGLAAGFECKGVDLVFHMSVDSMNIPRPSPSGYAMSDIWGWADPQTGEEYAVLTTTHGQVLILDHPLPPQKSRSTNLDFPTHMQFPLLASCFSSQNSFR